MSLLDEINSDIFNLSIEDLQAKYKTQKFDEIFKKGLPLGVMIGDTSTIKADFIDDYGVAYRHYTDDMYCYEMPAFGSGDIKNGLISDILRSASMNEYSSSVFKAVPKVGRRNRLTGLCLIMKE